MLDTEYGQDYEIAEASTSGGCCCAPAGPSILDTVYGEPVLTEPAYDYTTTVFEEPVSTEQAYTEQAYTEQAYTEAYTEQAYTEPAVQEWSQSPIATEPATQWSPSMATIGGTEPYGTPIVDAWLDTPSTQWSPSMATIGGTEPYGTPVSGGPGSITISSPQSGSMADNLSTIYGTAVKNGDIMSQIMVNNLMQSQNAMIDTWLRPSVIVEYR